MSSFDTNGSKVASGSGVAGLMSVIGQESVFGSNSKEDVANFIARLEEPLKAFNAKSKMQVHTLVVNEDQGLGLPVVALYTVEKENGKSKIFMFSFLFEAFLSDEPFKTVTNYRHGSEYEEERLRSHAYNAYLRGKVAQAISNNEVSAGRITGEKVAVPCGYVFVSGNHSFEESNIEGSNIVATYVNEAVGALSVASKRSVAPTVKMLKEADVTLDNKVEWCPGETGIDDNGKPFARDFKIMVAIKNKNPKGDPIHGGNQVLELVEVSGVVDFIFSPTYNNGATFTMPGQPLPRYPGYVVRVGITNLSRPTRNKSRVVSGMTTLALALASVHTVTANNEFLQFANMTASNKANMGNLERGWDPINGCLPKKAPKKPLLVKAKINPYASNEDGVIDPMTAYTQFCSDGVVITFDTRLGGINYWFEETLVNIANALSPSSSKDTLNRAIRSREDFINAIDQFIGNNKFSTAWGDKPIIAASPILLPDATYNVDSEVLDIRSFDTLSFLEANNDPNDFAAFNNGQVPNATKAAENELKRLYINGTSRYKENGNIGRLVLNNALPSAIMQAIKSSDVTPTFSGLMSTNVEQGMAQFGTGAFGVVRDNNLVNTIYGSQDGAYGHGHTIRSGSDILKL